MFEIKFLGCQVSAIRADSLNIHVYFEKLSAIRTNFDVFSSKSISPGPDKNYRPLADGLTLITYTIYFINLQKIFKNIHDTFVFCYFVTNFQLI